MFPNLSCGCTAWTASAVLSIPVRAGPVGVASAVPVVLPTVVAGVTCPVSCPVAGSMVCAVVGAIMFSYNVLWC